MVNKIIGLAMGSTILALIGGVCEKAYLGETATSRLSVLMTAPTFGQSDNWIAIGAEIASFGWDWITNLFGMLFWDYSFFQGEWQIVRFILCIPISIGIIYGIVSMMRGTNAG